MIGRRFGKLTVIEQGPTYYTPKRQSQLQWRCQCDCGGETVVRGGQLRLGRVKSCGCLHIEALLARSVTHGQSRGGKRTKAYSAWKNMHTRCYNPNHVDWHSYGGRGIAVAPQWRSYEQFYADMGDPPEGCSLDRIDFNGDYCAANCRWATFAEQSRNTRQNVWVTYKGRRMVLADAAHEAGLSPALVYSRKHQGWPEERLFAPVRSSPEWWAARLEN